MPYQKRQPVVEVVTLPGKVNIAGTDANEGDYAVFEDKQFVGVFAPEEFEQRYEEVGAQAYPWSHRGSVSLEPWEVSVDGFPISWFV